MSETSWTRRAFWLGGGSLAAAAAFIGLQPRAWAFHRGMGGLGGHHGGFGHRFLGDPEAAKERASLAVDWVLKTVDGSEEQRQQAKAVTDRAIDALAPIAEKHKGFRQAIARELAKPSLDRAELERLRQEELRLADEASRAAIAALADFAEVLRPEQRAELLDWAERLHR
ncbi:MAG TPA: Spy/CpxP family protein refolding chaperone [Vicinamibacteria bacterium]|nr:Spy/CpxP family protein refolding chaperone [Vicinamibacteria bacterium]